MSKNIQEVSFKAVKIERTKSNNCIKENERSGLKILTEGLSGHKFRRDRSLATARALEKTMSL